MDLHIHPAASVKHPLSEKVAESSKVKERLDHIFKQLHHILLVSDHKHQHAADINADVSLHTQCGSINIEFLWSCAQCT